MLKNYKDLLGAALAMIETIPTEEAIKLVKDDSIVFVDLRDRRELEREGRIPGAFHCPRGMLEFWIDPESPYHKPIFAEGKKYVFYCASAWRSALATKTCVEMGLEPVAHVGGGFTAWKLHGGPVEEVEKH
ncbi:MULTISPECIES: rhodanese-like domain-containing protein [Roseobacteraceae]|jgi:rhodanese-related sulfurtransferase|uniref:rhodanese-like domain-containing protein n=1 Tax=Roseobacteraceae TaxID=2854170 RepID=UPI00125F3D98|nr:MULTISPECIES: rhodanese-like domain-containing protein [Roseobacteraceae]KAB6715216.1 rhodanese [Roseobacter sp. TSBP12]|tara:strand:+ start:5038 stop:5430 length:393 start_codon:yes stop_codon:yes gene_type:complete